mmetsp:Transcript_7290/g.26856  ORF Transcript_7290/g.26856 Transcript_7290/m.26856 type:complete len:103 (+) Transcript_7290:618-926(+)
MPGTGGLVRAVECASGRTAVNVGKGGDWLLPFLVSRFQLDPSRTCVVGDRLDTDIAMATEAGMASILPLTGVTKLDDLREERRPVARPTFVIDSLASLGEPK